MSVLEDPARSDGSECRGVVANFGCGRAGLEAGSLRGRVPRRRSRRGRRATAAPPWSHTDWGCSWRRSRVRASSTSRRTLGWASPCVARRPPRGPPGRAALLVAYEAALVIEILAAYVRSRAGGALRYLLGPLRGRRSCCLRRLAFGAPWHFSYRYVDSESRPGSAPASSASAAARARDRRGARRASRAPRDLADRPRRRVRPGLLARRSGRGRVCAAVAAASCSIDFGYFDLLGGVSPRPRCAAGRLAVGAGSATFRDRRRALTLGGGDAAGCAWRAARRARRRRVRAPRSAGRAALRPTPSLVGAGRRYRRAGAVPALWRARPLRTRATAPRLLVPASGPAPR